MPAVRLLFVTLLACLVTGAAAPSAHAGSVQCHNDIFFSYAGYEYILGDMFTTGKAVPCRRVHAVGKAYTRRQLERVPGWRCGGTPLPAMVRLTCVKRCSRVSMLVLGLALEGRPRGATRLPKRCRER